ncbi:MAG: acylneuraminate cytidylyltransferase family protein [Candidatus Omnitrophica bacterium]|nr:acylneuraminate cytidylyltransferase family protein [Candidatus Omnitrophota bacterium]
MNVLATIAARGGSKGVPGKNIKELLGRPLIAYTIEQAVACDFIDRVVCSTDSEEILDIAKQYGAEGPFIRPLELAQDSSAKLPVIQHAARYYIDRMGFVPDVIIDLDPTSPLRAIDDIKKCFDVLLSDEDCDTVITGYLARKNPYFNMVEDTGDGYVQVCKGDGLVVSRQSAPTVYSMNASIYAWRTEDLFKLDNVLRGRTRIVEMPYESSVDIDSLFDFKTVEFLMKEKGNHGIGSF